MIALFPLLGLGIFARTAYLDADATARAAEGLEADLATTTTLQRLRVFLPPSGAAETIAAGLAPLGMTIPESVEASGIEEPLVIAYQGQELGVLEFARTQIDADAIAFERAVQALPESELNSSLDEIVEMLAEVAPLREQAADQTVDADEVREFYDQLIAKVESASRALEARNLDLIRQEGHFGDAATRLTSLISLNDALSALTTDVTASALVLIDVPGVAPAELATADLVAAIAAQEDSFARFSATATPEALAVFNTLDSQPAADRHRALQAKLLASVDFDKAEPGVGGIEYLNAGFAHLVSLIDLPEVVALETTDALTVALSRSESDRTRAVAVTAVLAGVTFLTTVAAFLLLARPLRKIQAHASRISAGDLNGDPLGPIGPGSIAALSTTLDDLAANLRAVDAQARSLAAGETDSSAFDRTPPGPIGTSLRQALDQLTSMTSALVDQAKTDSLTGLPNRAAVVETIESAFDHPMADVTVLFVDLDRFKNVNDSYGHRVGDELLVVVAERMTSVLGHDGFLGRLGGDEFIVVFQTDHTHESAALLADQLVQAVSAPVELEAAVVTVGASVGVAFRSDGSATASELMHAADMAVYVAKGSDVRYSIAGPASSPFGPGMGGSITATGAKRY